MTLSTRLHSVAAFCFVGLLGLGSTVYAQDAEFHALGDLPGGEYKSRARAVSDDGRTVSGLGSDVNFDRLTGILWSAESGILPLDDDIGIARNPQSLAMSTDGHFVVGRFRDPESGVSEAFRWTESDGLLELQSPEGYTRNTAWDISSDGSVVVGDITTSDFEKTRAFRWTQQSGMTELGLLNGGDLFSYGFGVSGDGRVIVGASGPPQDIGEAFRWTDSEGMVGLGFLPGDVSSRADDVSNDGSIIVGSSQSRNDDIRWQAFRWVESQGMTTLGTYPPGIIGSSARAVSASGQVIVGSWNVPNSQSIVGYDSHAMVWTESTGPIELREALISGGAQGLENWILEHAEEVSGNGQWVVGHGINPDGNEEAFLARLDSDIVPRFRINPGMNDAWYNPATSGQGFLVTVFPLVQQVFVAWFTFDAERPPGDVEATLGEPGHRWLTAQGPYSGDTATLTIYVTQGGVFDAAVPSASADPAGDGTLTLEFADCSNAIASYEITSAGLSGSIPLERIANDNVSLCEALVNQ